MKKNNMDKYAELFGDLESSHFKKDNELVDVNLDTKDVYPEDEHKETEDVVGIVIESLYYNNEEFNNFIENINEESLDKLTECYELINILDENNEIDNLDESLLLLLNNDEVLNEGLVRNIRSAVKAGINHLKAQNRIDRAKKDLQKAELSANKDFDNDAYVQAEKNFKKAKIDKANDARSKAQKTINKSYRKSTGTVAKIKNHFNATKGVDTKGLDGRVKRALKAEVRAKAWNDHVNKMHKVKLDSENQANKEQEKLIKTAEKDYSNSSAVKNAEKSRQEKIDNAKKTADKKIANINKKYETNLKEMSDYEIFSLLEEAGIEVTLANLDKVKSGDIVIEKKPEVEENQVEEPKEEKIDLSNNHVNDVDNKTVYPESEHHLSKDIPQKDKYDCFKNRFSDKSSELLESYLVEDCGGNIKEVKTLNEDVKVESVKEIASLLLNSLNEKLSSIDTTVADRSKGDIKSLRELGSIQDAITKLEELLSRSNVIYPEAKEYIGIVIRSILFINQYSAVFKEAYRNKKVLLIMKYQSLILSVISSVSYLISVLIDFQNGGSLKQNIALEKIAPIKALEEFNNSVESGEFKIITKDINIVREHYTEVSVENLSKLYEAPDYLPMIVDTVKSILSNLSTNGKLTSLVYKATGIIVLLFSLRDIMYTLYRMKTKVADMIQNINGFANINLGGSLSKLGNFANTFKLDVENSTEISSREIQDENRQLLNQVKTIQVNNKYNDNVAQVQQEPVDVATDDFNFDF